MKDSFGTSNVVGKRNSPRIYVIELKQDDPSKNTSAKMRRFGYATIVSAARIPRESIVLDPFSELILLPKDGEAALRFGLVVVDCSWAHAEQVFSYRYKGIHRKLPALLAGNPTNYSRLGSLSSLEASAAALYIMNFKEQARKMLSLYKWGETFLTLNIDPLEEYSRAESQDEISSIERSYFSRLLS
ncbi:MAG: DUF367 family protein [Thaumarchaeota archaeon]|nr:DUF367 family protein [Nitrososphaerota archaeon]